MLVRYIVPDRENISMWTDERVEQLKSLWTEGLSASQIARVLGGVTRNAVIGKVHRLGLAGRASPARSERPRISMTPKVSLRATHLSRRWWKKIPSSSTTAASRRCSRSTTACVAGRSAILRRTNFTSAGVDRKRARPIAKPMPARPTSRNNSAATVAGWRVEGTKVHPVPVPFQIATPGSAALSHTGEGSRTSV